MATILSSGTNRRIAALFPESQQAEVAELLIEECGDNLPFADTLGAAGVERVQFAVLKLRPCKTITSPNQSRTTSSQLV